MSPINAVTGVGLCSISQKCEAQNQELRTSVTCKPLNLVSSELFCGSKGCRGPIFEQKKVPWPVVL